MLQPTPAQRKRVTDQFGCLLLRGVGFPVKSPKRAITIANRTKDNEINLLATDWARINRALDAEEEQFPQGGG